MKDLIEKLSIVKLSLTDSTQNPNFEKNRIFALKILNNIMKTNKDMILKQLTMIYLLII